MIKGKFYMFICMNRYSHNFLYTRCMCSKIFIMIRKTQSNINDVKGKCQTVNYHCASSTMVFPRSVRLDVYVFWNNSLTQIFLPMSMDFWWHFIQPLLIWRSVKSTVPYSEHGDSENNCSLKLYPQILISTFYKKHA